LSRNNLALAITSTEDARFGTRCDPAELLAKHAKNDTQRVDFLLGLFLQGDVPDAARDKLLAYLKQTKDVKFPAYWSADDIANHRTRAVTHLVLTLPEYQLN
jgi:hypothetical protein